ncbi:MAG: OmpA family protein [bacterium]
MEGLKTIYYDFNAADLTEESKQTMARNAARLNANPGAQVRVEGHCDSRGSAEYNLALGEKRALSARAYLKQLGADTSRLEVVSYGEERPAEYGEDEDLRPQPPRRVHRPLTVSLSVRWVAARLPLTAPVEAPVGQGVGHLGRPSAVVGATRCKPRHQIPRTPPGTTRRAGWRRWRRPPA